MLAVAINVHPLACHMRSGVIVGMAVAHPITFVMVSPLLGLGGRTRLLDGLRICADFAPVSD